MDTLFQGKFNMKIIKTMLLVLLFVMLFAGCEENSSFYLVNNSNEVARVVFYIDDKAESEYIIKPNDSKRIGDLNVVGRKNAHTKWDRNRVKVYLGEKFVYECYIDCDNEMIVDNNCSNISILNPNRYVPREKGKYSAFIFWWCEEGVLCEDQCYRDHEKDDSDTTDDKNTDLDAVSDDDN